MPTRRLIFVLGMHRSGTSALARAVHLQGATLPKTLMPAQAVSQEGLYESQETGAVRYCPCAYCLRL
jgi:hypothetical protein